MNLYLVEPVRRFI